MKKSRNIFLINSFISSRPSFIRTPTRHAVMMKQSDNNNATQQRHFSHHHPLLLSNVQPEGDQTCSACKLKVIPAKEHYRCVTCQFVLHQVCYNMPLKIQHPGHPIHNLNLLVTSNKESFNCKACGNEISGLYYSCEKCWISYHILCANLPLSVAIRSHLHAVKLEFTPPYDFECDLCQKSCCNNGWSYRCQFCEFDLHLACAVSDKRTEFGKQFREMEYGNEENDLTQWIQQGMVHSSVADERSSQSTQDISGVFPKIQTTGRTGLVFGDACATPSYHLSESCFSIDLENSDTRIFPDVKETGSYHPNVLFDRNFYIPKETKQELQEFNKIRHAANYRGPENKMNEALLIGHGVTSSRKGSDQKIRKTESVATTSIIDQNSISDTVKPSPGGLWKVLGCCATI